MLKILKQNSDKLRAQDEEKTGRWLITYCSLIITLVAVFMMLVSYSSVSNGKVKSYRQGLGFSNAALLPIADRSADFAENAVQNLRQHAEMNGYSGKVQLSKIKNGFKVTIPGNMAFSPESAVIQEEVQPLLVEMTGILKKGIFSVGVAGYTSERPTSINNFASNWELSSIRAANIVRYFINTGKIPESRLACAGYGQYHPAVSGTSEDAKEKNDRLEFLFILPES